MSTYEFRKDVVTLFDLRSEVEGGTMSPYTFITRYNLKMKGIPFHTEWFGFTDIQEFARGQGVAPTVPIIHDPSTSTTIADSFRIAQYLDKTYPDTRRIIPPGSASLHQAFRTAVQTLETPIFQFAVGIGLTKIEREKDIAYFRTTREAFFGKKLEELEPKGDAAKTEWAKVKEFHDQWNSWFEGDNKFIGGEEPIFADIMLAGKVFWARTLFGKDSWQWKDIKSWNGGRWEALLAEFETRYA